MSMKRVIDDFVNNVMLYPPVELFNGIENPTPKQKKAEKRIMDICEGVYRIDFAPILNLRVAYREWDVIMRMGVNAQIKFSAYDKAAKELIEAINEIYPHLESTFKKDQELNAYWKRWVVPRRQLCDTVNNCIYTATEGYRK